VSEAGEFELSGMLLGFDDLIANGLKRQHPLRAPPDF
jgi:hypothetical protein